MRRLLPTITLITCAFCSSAQAQEERRLFAGVLFGVSALSADARAETRPPAARVSLYDSKNGLALNLFAGIHLVDYVSLQANYVWNRNDLTLVSTAVTAEGGRTYEQQRSSAQGAFVADALVYFRKRNSRIRPYLGTGLAVVRFKSHETRSVASGLLPPAAEVSSTDIALRSHVGIDVALTPTMSFRYSFSETIGNNPISPRLTPPGDRGLMNFQNLFGVLGRF